jgi:hypothetical protein
MIERGLGKSSWVAGRYHIAIGGGMRGEVAEGDSATGGIGGRIWVANPRAWVC